MLPRKNLEISFVESKGKLVAQVIGLMIPNDKHGRHWPVLAKQIPLHRTGFSEFTQDESGHRVYCVVDVPVIEKESFASFYRRITRAVDRAQKKFTEEIDRLVALSEMNRTIEAAVGDDPDD